MFKKLCTIMTIAGVFIFFFLFFQRYLPYARFKNSSNVEFGLHYIYLNQTNASQSTQALKYLNELSKIPLLGFLFYEDKVVQLALLERYEESLRECEKAL